VEWEAVLRKTEFDSALWLVFQIGVVANYRISCSLVNWRLLFDIGLELTRPYKNLKEVGG
jgi:hypothetical protein